VKISVVVLSIGASGLLIAWGISFVWHYVPPELKIANPEIRLVPPDPLTVKQDKPFTVTQDKPFTIAQPEPLKIDVGSLPSFRQEPQKTAGGDVIRREVTVFSRCRGCDHRVEIQRRKRRGAVCAVLLLPGRQ
jgi:hypothetical protein